jgi:hypothetical protein
MGKLIKNWLDRLAIKRVGKSFGCGNGQIILPLSGDLLGSKHLGGEIHLHDKTTTIHEISIDAGCNTEDSISSKQHETADKTNEISS